jgi:shikimate kinase
MMGSGKSTVGRLAADRLGIPFFDTDVIVQEQAGVSIVELWAEVGETGFRDLESAALRNVPTTAGIVAAGGGAVLDPANRELIARSDKVVWLRCDAATLAERLRANVSRPLLTESPETTLETLLAERAAIYADLATHHIETGARTLDEVVSEVVGIWQS